MTNANEDRLAQTVSRAPLKGGGANFRTHQYVQLSSRKATFRATPGMYLFAGVFIGLGLLALSINPDGEDWSDLLVPRIVGFVFALVGALVLYFSRRNYVFDKQLGRYYRNDQAADRRAGGLLADIHAIQIISEHVSGDDSNYTSYELNLVLKNGERLNVTDHGNRQALLADTRQLAAFLGVPVWDNSR